MGKRFFDTELCEKDWYLELTLAEREVVRLALSKCDCVGVWKPSRKIAEAIAGPVDIDSIPIKTEGNIEILPGGKWFIVDFCALCGHSRLDLAIRILPMLPEGPSLSRVFPPPNHAIG